MGRTQAYLGEEELSLLDEAARATGASRTALVRQAVRRTFGPLSKAEKLRALEASAGSRSGRNFTGTEHVEEFSGDLHQQLRALSWSWSKKAGFGRQHSQRRGFWLRVGRIGARPLAGC